METPRSLDLVLRVTEYGELEVDILEPESGTADLFLVDYSPDDHSEFDRFIGEQIYNYLKIWNEE